MRELKMVRVFSTTGPRVEYELQLDEDGMLTWSNEQEAHCASTRAAVTLFTHAGGETCTIIVGESALACSDVKAAARLLELARERGARVGFVQEH